MAESKRSESRYVGFEKGLRVAAETLTRAKYDVFFGEVRDVCLTTEERGNSESSFYNKRHGRMPMTTKEVELLDGVFGKYGIKEWRGNA